MRVVYPAPVAAITTIQSHADPFVRWQDSILAGRALLDAIPKLKPDIVILDISIPVLNGIDVARLLKVKYPQVKVVFITMHADPAYVRAAFEAGASAYLLKRCVGEELGQAMRAVRSGNFYITLWLPRMWLKACCAGSMAGRRRGQSSRPASARCFSSWPKAIR